MATAQLGTLLRHLEHLAAHGGSEQRTDGQLLDDFAAHGDESAFAALVARHGPMVLRLCRRVLHQEQDAEDAFQATFLVLARGAASIRQREALAGFLHGVAYRIALKARRSAARRRHHEAQLRARTPAAVTAPTWDDVQAILDAEVQRLPAPLRSAFVLCVLEGRSGPQVAALLGCKVGTVSSRLTRARQRLQRQLARRGIQLSALLAALSVAASAARASVPTVLVQATVRFGLLATAGEPAANLIPSHVAALAAGVSRAMFLTKTKIATVVLLAAGLIAAGAGVLRQQTLADQQTKAPPGPKAAARRPAPEAKPPAADDKDTLTYSGRVLGPDGQPVAVAKLYLSGVGTHWQPLHQRPTSGADGRFRFAVPRAQFGDTWALVTAAAANHGPGWVMVPRDGKRDHLTIRLVKDDVPIVGQVVDLEGKPVAGATLRVQRIDAAAGEDLDPWVNAVQARKGPSWVLAKRYLDESTSALSPRAVTDAEGRFRLGGIGRNRLVTAQLDGPAIASQELHILTRPGKPLVVTDNAGIPRLRRSTTYYPANFRHIAAPTRPVVGVVRDRDTRKPLAGVTIQSYKIANNPIPGLKFVETTTDARGRYRLMGLPKGAGNKVLVIPGRDRPYLASFQDVPDSPGLGPVRVDIELKRGVWIEGKITDKATGEPLKVSVEYYSLAGNPNLRDYPGFGGRDLGAASGYLSIFTNEDGSYRVVGLPGPGLVVAFPRDHYLRAPERDDEYRMTEGDVPFTAPYQLALPISYGAFARIDGARGVEAVKRDVTLDPGWTFTGTLLDPNGKPLAGARGFGLRGTLWWDGEERKTAGFTVRGFNPHRPRDLLFQHADRGLVGVAQPPKANGGTVKVRMGPGATVAGRLVDAGGRPRAGVELEVRLHLKKNRYWVSFSPERLRTDREGRFRIGALWPGWEYRLSDDEGDLSFGDGLRAGRTKVLGDVQLQRGDK